MHVDLNGFVVDFTQYDEFHGAGTAERVVREIREALAAHLALSILCKKLADSSIISSTIE